MTLEKTQKRITELFSRQIKQDKVSHAYLLVGENNTRALAEYMAQSLFCENYTDEPCKVCDSCVRIKNQEHGDYVFLSGQSETIKKEDVMEVKSRFLQTSLEDVKHKVYVIEDVDNASLVAMNSFLKFLEEPDSNIVAILTTSNLNKVLETIKSRCLILHLEKEDKQDLEQKLIEEGVSIENAKSLAYIASSVDEALTIHDDKMFHHVADTFYRMKALYDKNKYQEAGILLQVAGIKEHKFNLSAIKWLLKMHQQTYSIQNLHKENDQTKLHLLKISMDIQDRIRPGVISSMLIDQFVYELNKGA
ncbi:MAG TPA: DNA polymerase III subunit [Erysipelothrix sp.]|nr:DNA polymerase III subunit [Erysipelothrix sp.]